MEDESDNPLDITKARDIVRSAVVAYLRPQSILQPALLDGVQLGDADGVSKAKGGNTHLVARNKELS